MPDWTDELAENIRNAAEIMRGSSRCVILTGAGISTPSGIPDFRSQNTGMWEYSDPNEVASLLAFRYHPEQFFQWMRPLAARIRAAEPNPAHLGFSRLQRSRMVRTIITQNIDGLHQRSGSTEVLEVHGSLETLTCIRCFQQFSSALHIDPYIKEGIIPLCPDCGGILKPDIVLFGEQMPARAWLKALEASRGCDLMIVAGSSLEVLPVAGLPMRALENGAHLIIINRTATYLDIRADVVFHEDLALVVPLLVNQIFGE